MKKIVILLCVVSLQLFGLELGKQLPYLELVKKDGGYLNYSRWTSNDMDAKINIIFYVDPDLKDLNDDFAKELQNLHLSSKELKVFVVINMKASWIPNMLIDTVLESKQKKFPEAHYVKDNSQILVKKWAFKDDGYDIVAVNEEHNVLFSHSGEMTFSVSIKFLGEIKDELHNYNR